MTTANPQPAPAPPVPLDQVMLAMDVVDTLRHRQDLIDAELDEDRRRREFTERVQAIYRAQGIEVSEAVIQDAVRSLREDRFTYKPPPRTFTVRLAEIYVERRKWALRAGMVLLLGLVGWLAFAVPASVRRHNQVESFRRDLVATTAVAAELDRQAGLLRAELAGLRQEVDSTTSQELLAQADAALGRGQKQVATVREELTPPPDPEQYPEQKQAFDQRLQGQKDVLGSARGDLGAARGLLQAVRQVQSLGVQLTAALARLSELTLSPSEQAAIDSRRAAVQGAIERGDGKAGETALRELRSAIDGLLRAREAQATLRTAAQGLAAALGGVVLEDDVRQELAGFRQTTDEAMAAGDWVRAEQQVAQWRELVEILEQNYELRIVSQPNEQSGVWRHPDGRRSARNYYIIVDAVGPDGRPVRLPVTSEEDQRTRRVSRFGVRVPEAVYEQVKADKLDNGIVDRVEFGRKRRGARVPEYLFPVEGGRITAW